MIDKRTKETIRYGVALLGFIASILLFLFGCALFLLFFAVAGVLL